MGKPTAANPQYPLLNKIGNGGERGELKHLSTLRKRKQCDSLSSGERNGNSPNPTCVRPQPLQVGGCGIRLGAIAVAPESHKPYT